MNRGHEHLLTALVVWACAIAFMALLAVKLLAFFHGVAGVLG